MLTSAESLQPFRSAITLKVELVVGLAQTFLSPLVTREFPERSLQKKSQLLFPVASSLALSPAQMMLSNELAATDGLWLFAKNSLLVLEEHPVLLDVPTTEIVVVVEIVA